MAIAAPATASIAASATAPAPAPTSGADSDPQSDPTAASLSPIGQGEPNIADSADSDSRAKSPADRARNASPITSAADRKKMLDTVRASLAVTTSLTADFIQTNHQGQRVVGKLTLKRPGKIRFQYQEDVPLLIVGDGASLTMIDYEVNQVQRWPVKKSPMMALLDPKRAFTRYAEIIPMASEQVIAVALADPKYPEFGTMTMMFLRDADSPGGLLLRGWITQDAQNYRTRIDLANQKFNIAIPDTAFQWRDPRRRKRLR